jgi:hypothetical protein
VQQVVVLPETEAERHRYGDRANDEPGAQLAEVVDDAESILVPDGPEDPCHRDGG